MIGKALTKIFGTKSDRDIKLVMPYVEKTNEEHAKLLSISDDELREKTQTIKGIIDNNLETIDGQIADLHKIVEDDPEMDIFLQPSGTFPFCHPAMKEDTGS